MNRTMQMPAANRRSAQIEPTLADWIAVILACVGRLFGMPEVKMALRIFFGGAAFVTMLALVGGIESGTFALIPGGVLCVVLLVVAFLLLRGVSEEM